MTNATHSGLELHCRVCGLAQAEPPWGADGRSPTFSICDCCGTEFGYEDANVAAVRQARADWLARGEGWFVPEARPNNWILEDQVRNIPAQFV